MMSTLRLSLLPWKPGDWRQLTPLVTDPVVMRHITGGEAWSDAQTQAFVGRQRALHRSRGFCFWKLHEAASGTFVGFCGLQPLRHHDLIEVGWWLARDRWGLGLATEAARAAVADGFTRLDLARIVAITRPANTRSRAVMARLGMTCDRMFVYEGVKVVCYRLDRPAAVAGTVEAPFSRTAETPGPAVNGG
jgi:RimJ/RimL family protein N-acetyltransferase